MRQGDERDNDNGDTDSRSSNSSKDFEDKSSKTTMTSAAADNEITLKRVLNSHRLARDVDMLMNSVYWIQALKANSARGIGRDLYSQMCESQKFVQEFVKYSVNFQKAHFRSLLVAEKRKEKKHPEGLPKRPIWRGGQSDPPAGQKSIASLIERLRRHCDNEIAQQNAHAEIKLDVSLEFLIECVVLAILDIDNYIGTSAEIAKKLIDWFVELESAFLDVKKLVDKILNNTQCFKRLINSNKICGTESKPIILAKRQFMWSVDLLYLKPFIKLFFRKNDERLLLSPPRDANARNSSGNSVTLTVRLKAGQESSAFEKPGSHTVVLAKPPAALLPPLHQAKKPFENPIKKGNIFKPWKMTVEKFKLLVDLAHNSYGLVWHHSPTQTPDKSAERYNQLRFIKEALPDKPEHMDHEMNDAGPIASRINPTTVPSAAAIANKLQQVEKTQAQAAAVPVEKEKTTLRGETLKKKTRRTKTARPAQHQKATQESRSRVARPNQVMRQQPCVKRLNAANMISKPPSSFIVPAIQSGFAQQKCTTLKLDHSSFRNFPVTATAPIVQQSSRQMDVALVDINNNATENSCSSLDEADYTGGQMHQAQSHHHHHFGVPPYRPHNPSVSSSFGHYGSSSSSYYHSKTIYPHLASSVNNELNASSASNSWSIGPPMNSMETSTSTPGPTMSYYGMGNSYCINSGMHGSSSMHANHGIEETNHMSGGGVQPSLSSAYNPPSCCYSLMHPSSLTTSYPSDPYKLSAATNSTPTTPSYQSESSQMVSTRSAFHQFDPRYESYHKYDNNNNNCCPGPSSSYIPHPHHSLNEFYNNFNGSQQQQQQQHPAAQMSYVSPPSPNHNHNHNHNQSSSSFTSHQAPGTKYYLLSLAPSSLATAIKSNAYNDQNCYGPAGQMAGAHMDSTGATACVEELFNEDLLVQTENFQ